MATEKQRALGHARSPQWPAVEKRHLKEEPFCRYCGGTQKLQVHHIKPFHLHPESELDDRNLITLCEDSRDGVECHLHIGHLGNWRLFNPHVRAVADSKRAGQRSSHFEQALCARALRRVA